MQLSLLNLDQKNALLRKLVHRASKDRMAEFDEQLRTCWVLHDHALEGVVLNQLELSRGIANERGRDVCQDAVLHGIHRLYLAIDQIRREATDDAQARDVDLKLLKHVHALVSAEGSEQGGRYRKTDGTLGAYMHDAPPARTISYRMRKLVELIDEELGRLHPVRAAATLHFHYMQVFAFDELTGRAGRLLMNYWLMREGYPPAIIPVSVRADYYNALCSTGPADLTRLVIDALDTTIDRALDVARSSRRARVAA